MSSEEGDKLLKALFGPPKPAFNEGLPTEGEIIAVWTWHFKDRKSPNKNTKPRTDLVNYFSGMLREHWTSQGVKDPLLPVPNIATKLAPLIDRGKLVSKSTIYNQKTPESDAWKAKKKQQFSVVFNIRDNRKVSEEPIETMEVEEVRKFFVKCQKYFILGFQSVSQQFWQPLS